jgi:hypothetical protein
MKRFTPTFFWGVFFLYPAITLNVIQSVDCIRLGIGDDTFYLKKDMSVLCWSYEHWFWLGWLYIPLLILVVFGVPIATFIYLNINHSEQIRIILATDPTKFDTLNARCEHTLRTFGFLFDGYDVSFWWWAVLVVQFLKSILIVLVTIFGSQSLKLLAAVVFLTFMLTLIGVFSPYMEDSMDIIEFLSFLVVWSFAMSGVYQFVAPAEPKMAVISLTCAIVFGIVFVGVACYMIVNFFRHDPAIAAKFTAMKSKMERGETFGSSGGKQFSGSNAGTIVIHSDDDDSPGAQDALLSPVAEKPPSLLASPAARAAPTLQHALTMPMKIKRNLPGDRDSNVVLVANVQPSTESEDLLRRSTSQRSPNNNSQLREDSHIHERAKSSLY